MNKKVLAVSLVCVLVFGTQSWACSDIAVVSRDGRFIVLDGDDLKIVDVGNLWWLGVRRVDGAAPGSTLDWALLSADRVLNPGTGLLREEFGFGRTNARFVLKDLERQYSPPTSLRNMPDISLFEVKWIANASVRYLLAVSRMGDAWFITVMDPSFNVIGRWPSPDPTMGMRASCVAADGRIILGGANSRAVVAQGKMTVEKLDRADRGYELDASGIGCLATMAKPNPQNSSLRDVVIIDLAQNNVRSAYSRPGTFAFSQMFADGTRILQQQAVGTPVPNTPGFSVRPTNVFRIIDTTNGNTVQERTLNIALGELHDQILCGGESDRVLIHAPNAVHLVGLPSLKVLATRELPFSEYFVLGSSGK